MIEWIILILSAVAAIEGFVILFGKPGIGYVWEEDHVRGGIRIKRKKLIWLHGMVFFFNHVKEVYPDEKEG